MRQAPVKALAPDSAGWRVMFQDGAIRARHVVVALGPWSPDILRPLGYRVPMAFERGYHREFTPDPARKLLRPINDADGSFLMTPMENGVRITSGVELTDRDAPSSFAQLDQVVPLARSVVEFGEAVGEPWRGARPTLPDVAADDRASAAAFRPVACFRQPAYRFHHGAGDGGCDRGDDCGRAAILRRHGLRAEPLSLTRKL